MYILIYVCIVVYIYICTVVNYVQTHQDGGKPSTAQLRSKQSSWSRWMARVHSMVRKTVLRTGQISTFNRGMREFSILVVILTGKPSF